MSTLSPLSCRLVPTSTTGAALRPSSVQNMAIRQQRLSARRSAVDNRINRGAKNDDWKSASTNSIFMSSSWTHTTLPDDSMTTPTTKGYVGAAEVVADFSQIAPCARLGAFLWAILAVNYQVIGRGNSPIICVRVRQSIEREIQLTRIMFLVSVNIHSPTYIGRHHFAAPSQ